MDVVRNREKNRFEVDLGDGFAFADYIEKSDAIVFPHTEVPPKHEGQGIGTALVVAGLEYARENALKVYPLCPFFASYIAEHPEYRDLVGT